MPFKDYRKESKKNWGVEQDAPLNREQIQTGALLRIADASEAMAQNQLRLQADLEYYRKKYTENNQTIERLVRSNNALRGWIKRLKKKSL